jgi:hypothetical protein
MKLLRAFHRYWFEPAPLLDLAVFRIAAAAGQFVIWSVAWHPTRGHFEALSEIPHLYDPLAVLRLMTRVTGGQMPSLATVTILYWITLAAALLAAVGLFTNVSLAVLTVGSVFVQSYAYSFGDFHHPEAIMAIALAILTISPCGRVLSVDHWRRRRRLSEEERRAEAPASDQVSEFARWPRLLLMWMFSLVYLSAAYYKLKSGGWHWMNGYTLQYALFQDGLRWDRPLGQWLAGHHGAAVVMSAFCLLFEGGFWLTLVFPALAVVALPMGFGMHLGIQILMKANFFEYLVLYPALVPWTLVGSYVRAWRQRRATIPSMLAAAGLARGH